MLVRLSHPWRWHHTLDVLDPANPEHAMTEDDARHLVTAGHAVPVDTLITATGGGWYTVQTSKGAVRARGWDKAVDELRKDAGQL